MLSNFPFSSHKKGKEILPTGASWRNNLNLAWMRKQLHLIQGGIYNGSTTQSYSNER